MDDATVARAAAALLAARARMTPLAALPADCRPDNEVDAYRIQAAYVDRLLAVAPDGRRVGFKAGCTNETAQVQLGLSAPFRGMLLSSFVRESPAEIASADGFMRMIEAEVAFRLGADLAPQAAPLDAASVRAAVAAAMPAIEVVDSRYADWTTAGAPQLIADNGCTGFWVHGAEVRALSAIDFADLPVQVWRNGVAAEQGNSANVLGNPLNSLAWLANHLPAYGLSLRAGDLVTTGTTIAVNAAEAGDEVMADFGPLGQVSVRFR